MVEPSETVHQTIPYVQIQPDWNVILDTIRLYGMLKKTVSSKLPKTFTSVGINGEEIEIQVRYNVVTVVWICYTMICLFVVWSVLNLVGWFWL